MQAAASAAAFFQGDLMVDLKAKPFCLDEKKINWVENTIASMSLEEKIGQLFIYLCWDRDTSKIKNICNRYHVGGLRWQGGNLEQIYEQNRLFQENSRIPLLIAANALSGGNGAVKEGTLVATGAAAGAAPTDEVAYRTGVVSAAESKAVGVNWQFGPDCDVLLNWRNTIINDRAYGNDPDKVIACSKAFMKAHREANIACCAKHFPGDGTEERDQHLVMGCNDLNIKEWENTFGKVYRSLIDEGVEAFMIGHICMPAYQKHFNPSLTDADIRPASNSPELLTDLLRKQLGFNGLITTDASHMAGLSTSAPRSYQVPHAIAAGCDMFLFFNDPDEDFGYMMKGYKDGVITKERLSDALHRILGLKAKLGLDDFTFPSKELLSCVNCEKHHEEASWCADQCVTLVKDTQKILPWDVKNKKRAYVYYLETQPVSNLDGPDKQKKIVIEELERAGFECTVHTDYYEMECEKMDPVNRMRIMNTPSVEEFKSKYDIVFLFVHIKGYAQENNNRIKWSAPHSNELPWYVCEVPAVGISLNYTNHLYDLPMMKTYINAYAPTREYIRATVEKITGKSKFKGSANDLVWCDRWDTRR